MIDIKSKYEKIKSGGPQMIYVVLAVVLLPLIIGAIFFVRQYQSSAEESCPPTNVVATRVTSSAGKVTFNSTCTVKASLLCSLTRKTPNSDPVTFFCGEDSVATTQHVITTSGVTLESNKGYYVYIQTGLPSDYETYIPPSTEAGFGLNVNSFSESVLGSEYGDTEYDPALDINGDGVINVYDQTYVLGE